MSQVNLTINKPGATQFNDEAKGLKIKVEDGKISVKFVKADSGAGVYSLFDRTRGGVGVTLAGSIVDKLLAVKGVEADTHMTLEATSYGWLVATPHEAKPSKLVPTLRLWNVRDEVADKADSEPVAKVKAAPKASRGGIKAKAKTAKPRAKKAAAAAEAAQ